MRNCKVEKYRMYIWSTWFDLKRDINLLHIHFLLSGAFHSQRLTCYDSQLKLN